MSCKDWFATSLIVLVCACEHESATVPPRVYPVSFMATNDLVAPVTISVDGAPYAFLSNGRATQLTLPSNKRLTWTSAKPADAEGHLIPDEIGEQQVDVSAIPGTLEITNVIGTQTYFTARLFNFTSLSVSIGVWDGTKVWCAAVLPAASPTAAGFVLIGYYRLLPVTEVRAYTASATCSGSFTSWPSLQINDLEAKSGRLTLALEPS